MLSLICSAFNKYVLKIWFGFEFVFYGMLTNINEWIVGIEKYDINESSIDRCFLS